MGAMAEEDEENWRVREDILEFAVLEAEAVIEVARARTENLCMGKEAVKGGEVVFK